MADVKKAVILMAGMGTRFLPLSKVVPKELWPLADGPVIQKIIEEIKESGIRQIILVLSPDNKKILDYIKPSPKIEKLLKERKKDKLLEEYKKFEQYFKDIDFKYVFQRQPLGDGNAVLQAAKLVKDEPFALFYSDDVVDSQKPCISQLMATFKTCQKPVVSLCRLSKEKLHFYGIVDVEKIANRFFKIKKVVEKPEPGKEPSDLSLTGKYILTPDIFQYLKKAKKNERGEIILADTFDRMLKDGKLIYGYEFEGKWLECGNKLDWLKSTVYLALKDPKTGPEIRKFLKDEKMI